MTTTLFKYPEHAAFGRKLPKNKIYAHAKPSTAVKKLFVQQVKQIVWQYKLAPETLNLKSSKAISEIQIFSMDLKGDELKPEVLRCIDLAIPFPIIFELQFNGKIKPMAAFKRPSQADASKWVISEYFQGDWVTNDTPRRPLPMVSDLETLYSHLLICLLPYPPWPGENLQSQVDRMESIRLKERELERCQTRLRKEKQFNRKVAINAELRKIKTKLMELQK